MVVDQLSPTWMCVKAIVQLKMKIKSIFHISSNMYDFLSQNEIFSKTPGSTEPWTPLTFIVWKKQIKKYERKSYRFESTWIFMLGWMIPISGLQFASALSLCSKRQKWHATKARYSSSLYQIFDYTLYLVYLDIQIKGLFTHSVFLYSTPLLLHCFSS